MRDPNPTKSFAPTGTMARLGRRLVALGRELGLLRPGRLPPPQGMPPEPSPGSPKPGPPRRA